MHVIIFTIYQLTFDHFSTNQAGGQSAWLQCSAVTGFKAAHSSSGRITLSLLLMVCTQSTVLILRPPPQVALHVDQSPRDQLQELFNGDVSDAGEYKLPIFCYMRKCLKIKFENSVCETVLIQYNNFHHSAASSFRD